MKTLPDLKSFCGHAPTGPTYTDLAREVDRLKADNAALLSVAKYFAEMLDDVVMNGSGADLGWMRPERAAAMLATIRAPHPGSALLDELERLRNERDAIMGSLIEAARFEMEWAFQDGNTPGYNARKARNYGDRANEYRLRAESAERELENLRKQVETLKQGQRSASEARQRAFLELAEDLATMTPEKRDAAIKRIIDNAGENR